MDSKKAKYILEKIREKQGQEDPFQQQLRSEAMRDILRTALIGGGIAGTIRGGQGLWNLLTRSREKLRSRPGVAPLPVPYHPSFKEEEEEKEAGLGTVLGLAIGAMKARKGEKLRGAGYGGGVGAATDIGMGVGSSLGALGGGLVGGLSTLPLGGIGSLPGMVIGSGVGAGVGGYGGYRVGKDIAEDVSEGSKRGLPWGKDKKEDEEEEEEEEKEAKYTGLGAMVGGVGGAGLTALLSMIANKENFRKEWYTNPPEGQKQHLMKGDVNTSQLGLNALGQGINSPLVGGAGIGAGIGGAIGKYMDIKDEEEEEKEAKYTGLGAMVGGVGGAGLAALLKAHSALWQHSGRHLPYQLGDIPSHIGWSMNPPSELLGGAGIGAGIGGAIGKYMDIKDEEEEEKKGYWRHGVHYSHKTKNLTGKKKKKQEKQATITAKTSLPWYMPAMLSAGVLGGVGTWKVIDHILDQRRRKELEDEVTTSRDEFQNALVSQYKQGSDSELGVALDELYLKMQKAAKLTDYLDPRNYLSDDQAGFFGGLYGTYAIPSALLSFLAIKKMTDKGSRRKIMEKAQRQRALKQQRARPAELYAVPSPIEEEEEEE